MEAPVSWRQAESVSVTIAAAGESASRSSTSHPYSRRTDASEPGGQNRGSRRCLLRPPVDTGGGRPTRRSTAPSAGNGDDLQVCPPPPGSAADEPSAQ
jgi:hypothetical protein